MSFRVETESVLSRFPLLYHASPRRSHTLYTMCSATTSLENEIFNENLSSLPVEKNATFVRNPHDRALRYTQ